MTVAAKTFSDPSRSHPPRKLRNFLLDPKFQLKYSLMVVAVTVVVASVLGYQAYRYSTGQTELFNLQRMQDKGEGAQVDKAFTDALERYSRQEDRKVIFGILSGIGLLGLALGLTGIVVTHRVVGPAYRLKRMFRTVGAGRLLESSSIRRHDELQDVFEAFQEMLKSLRTLREHDLRELDTALDQARVAGLPENTIAGLVALRERIQRSIQ